MIKSKEYMYSSRLCEDELIGWKNQKSTEYQKLCFQPVVFEKIPVAMSVTLNGVITYVNMNGSNFSR